MTITKPWAVTLSETTDRVAVVLRPIRRRDAAAWSRLRTDNAAWLDPWEASAPKGSAAAPSFPEYVRGLTRQARAGSCLPFVVEADGEMVGQLTVSAITYGSLRSASIGYWIAEHAAGRGIIPIAVAMACDYCFQVLGLHRMEIHVRPGNERSLRVVAKLGFRDEGVRERYLHIAGRWCDHRTFALTADEAPHGVLSRLLDVPPTESMEA